MKKNLLATTACLMIVMMAFVSCSKEGPAGATGPAGAAGAAGPAGPAGVAGATGPAGTANVIYSAWLDVAYSVDTAHNGALIDTLGYFANILAPKMTAAMINTGDIKVYWNAGTVTSPFVIPLPTTDVFNGLFINTYYFISTTGVSTIQLYANDNYGTFTSSGVKASQYRYILVQGSTTARSVVNWLNYAEVQKIYNLKD